jgi:hypothetical protein
MIQTVTFDANTIPTRLELSPEDSLVVREALKDGRIIGFFSQTYCSLEGIEKKNRPEVLAKTSVGSRSTSPSNNTINITIEIRHHRPPLNDKYSKAVQDALDLGLRALRGPARFVDGLRCQYPENEFYVVEPFDQLVAHRKKSNEVASAIEARGVGRAIGVELGNAYNTSAGVTSDNPKLWLQGLAHAESEAELKKVGKAIAEWSDGDGIASHVGYGIDIFCSNDFGVNAGGPSIMNEENRAWLSETYGVVFMTLSQLAQQIRCST